MFRAMRYYLNAIVVLAVVSSAVLSFASTPIEGVLPGQSQTLLPDGRGLLMGGEGPSGAVTTVLLRSPQNGLVSKVGKGLLQARAWHTATVLPDGKILVCGGTGDNGAVVSQAEIFDPTAETSTNMPTGTLWTRAYHAATLLTDGRVLISGGVDSNNNTLGKMELWDFRTGAATILAAELMTPRSKHNAALLPDGTVLIWGGVDAQGVTLNSAEAFDPSTLNTRPGVLLTLPASDPQPPQLNQALPENDATNVPVDVLLSLRFSKPLKMETVSAKTVVLNTSDNESVAAKVVAAEGGLLAFVTPAAPLATGRVFTLSLSELTDDSGQVLPDATITFTTDSAATGVGASSGSISTDPLNSPSRNLPPLQAATGVTALAGQVLKLDGSPLQRVSLEIDTAMASSDSTGRFLLQNLSPGHHVMIIDAGPASRHGKIYGIYRVGVDIQGGQTNVLKYTIWQTPLDTKHVVSFSSPTTSEVVVTNPDIPGLELHIPENTVVHDIHGKVLTRIGITPISMKQPPYPLKKGVVFPVYFTIQPGGASFSTAGTTWSTSGSKHKGARIHYQNYPNAKPGTRFNFWNYDPTQKGWYVYGKGRVSQDAKMIVPEPGVQIWSFDGAMVSQPGNAPDDGPTSDGETDGEPVDLQTGLFVYSKTDLALPDVIPIELTRVYRQNDFVTRSFGIGTSMPYDMFLVGDSNGNYYEFPEGYTYVDLILADGGRIHYTRTSPCDSDGYCSYANAVYAATSTPSDFYGSILQFNMADFWTLTKKDGTVYRFPDSDYSAHYKRASVASIHDRNGNSVTLDRDNNFNLIKITSTNGRWIQLFYDQYNRVTQAQDNANRTVSYKYDSAGNLSRATDANGGVTTYYYDSDSNMSSIQDPRGILYLTNTYDANNRVIKQIQADGGVFLFDYTLDANNNVTQTDVTDPRGFVRQVTFNADRHSTSDTKALGKPEQQTNSYTRQQGSGLILSFTDTLGRQTAYSYDDMGNATSITRLAGTPNEVTASATYEPLHSQILSVTNPLGNSISFTYDNNGNLVTRTDPLGNTTTMTYNSEGQVVTSTTPLGETTQFLYDSGDLVATTDPMGRIVSQFVDAAGRIGSITDPLGKVTKYAYDALNQRTSVTDSVGNQTKFNYDGDGNMLTLTDANQNTTTFTYDSMNRLQTRQDPLGNSESYQYDLAGNLSQLTDRRGIITTYSYDGLSNPLFVGFGQQLTPALNYESSISSTFDLGGRLTKIADSISGTVSRTYDSLDRLSSESTPQGTVIYSYDLAGRKKTMTVSDQEQVSYSYDFDGRLTQVEQGALNVGISYDGDGRRVALVLPNGIAENYSYNTASQLVGITYEAGENTIGNLSYSYNLAGRRVGVGGSFARASLPNAVAVASYNQNNQLVQWGSASPTYDANGNMLSNGANTYTWDARNRLVSLNGGAASFLYDPLGRRSAKTVFGISTSFEYDGVNPVQEQSNATGTVNLLTGGTDEYFMRSDINGYSSFLTDSSGSTVALGDVAGEVQTQYTYEPFGNTIVAGGASGNEFQYTGRENDGTGLYYYRSRYYDPTIGRFISEDPIGFWGGIDFYAYVLNDPADLTDPMGESPCLNIRNFVSEMNKNAAGITKSGGQCAGAVKKGLVKGGLDVSKLHNGPHNYGSSLGSLGFQPIDNHAPLKPGDIMIFQPWKNKAGGNGHIQVWNGSQWVSDFMQENMRSGYPGPGSTYEKNDPTYQLYRDFTPCP